MFEAYKAPVKFISAAKFESMEQSKRAYEALEHIARRNGGRGYHILARRVVISGVGLCVAFLALAREPEKALQDEIKRVYAKRGGELVTLQNDEVKMLCTPMDFAPGHVKEGNFTRWRSGY